MARMHAPGASNRRHCRRAGLRALAIQTMVGFLLLGLAACTLVGGGTTTAPVLNIDAPVPTGSGLYSLQPAQANDATQMSVVRFDAVTGKPQWQQAVPGTLPRLAVSDGILYAVSGSDVLALRGSDGARVWNATLSDVVQTQSNGIVQAGQQAAAADGRVYISVEDDSPASQHGQIVALRASDGTPVWSRAFDGSDNSGVVQGVAAGDGLVVVTTVASGTFALHATDGSLAWQAQYNGTVQLLGGLVYVDGNPAPLIALDEHTGALVWTLPCVKQTAIASSASGARIYIGCLEPQNPYATAAGIFAFDIQQRQLLWKYHTADFVTAPVADSDTVFIPNGTALDTVRASDGKRVWSQQAEEPNAGPVALALIGDTLYVRVSVKYPHIYSFGCDTSCKQSYSLSALRLSDGAAYWHHYQPAGTLWLIPA